MRAAGCCDSATWLDHLQQSSLAPALPCRNKSADNQPATRAESRLKALRLAQVRRKNLRGTKFCFLLRPSIQDARLLDFNRAIPGRDQTFWQMAIANDLPAPGLVRQAGMRLDPLGDFRPDRVRQHLLSATTNQTIEK